VRRIGVAAIVFAGLLALVEVPGLLSGITAVYRDPSDFAISRGAMLALETLPLVVALGTAVALIRFRENLAARWFDEGIPETAVGPVSLLQIGVVLSAVFVLMTSVPEAILAVVYGIAQVGWMQGDLASTGMSGASLWLTALGVAVAPIAQVAIAVIVILRAGELSRWLMRLRPVVEPAPVAQSACPNCGAPYDPADYEPGTKRLCASCHSPLDDDGDA